MNTTRTLLGLLFLSLFTPLSAQDAQPLNTKPRRINAPTNQATTEQSPALSTNYRITLSVKSGDKVTGDLSTLTCSRSIQVSGPIGDSEIPTIFKITGILDENEGKLTFTYDIDFTVPIVNQVQTGPQPANTLRNYQYQSNSASGTLRMKPGKAYEVLKAGGNTYSVTISPEEDK
jgi:hypothetical protein